MDINTTFVKKGSFYESGTDIGHPFDRGGRSPLVIAPGNRLKGWGEDLDAQSFTINGVDVVFQPKRHHFEFMMTTGQVQMMLGTEEEPDISDIPEKTLLERAYSIYRSMRWRYRRLSLEERRIYFFARQYRNYAKNWKRSGFHQFLERMDDSLEKTEEWVEQWQSFIDWMDEEVMPTEERFERVRGYPTTGRQTKRTSNGVSVSTDNAERFDSDKRAFHYFRNHIQSRIDEIGDQLDVALGDDDNLEHGGIAERHFANFMEEILAAGFSLGLDVHPVWEPGADGAVWFIDPETDKVYYTTMLWYQQYEVSMKVVARENPRSRWKDFPIVDLQSTALEVHKLPLQDLSRVFRDYFGYFNGSLRPYLEQAANPAPIDWNR